MSKKTFDVEYSNKDIFEKLLSIENKVNFYKTNLVWLKLLLVGSYGFTLSILIFFMGKF